MKLTIDNENYCATVIRIHSLHDLDGLNNLVAVRHFNYQALVSRDHQIGELGILFVAETKLSNDFCHHNNLYRDKDLNKDQEKAGYIERSGRVKALKLRGNLSTALFIPLSSLQYLDIKVDELKEGDTFTHINDIEICNKYVPVINIRGSAKNKVRGKSKKFIRVDAINFPEHYDTANYWRCKHNINDDDTIVVTQKLHGTSGRFGHIKVKRMLTWKDKIAKFFGIKVQEYEYDTIAGSRRVVKDLKSDCNYEHYYSSDIWNEHLSKIVHYIPHNIMLFGEIVGWIGNKPIQKNYCYNLPVGQSLLYVYRVAFINDYGFMVDFTWPQVKEFCNRFNLLHVPEIWVGQHKDFDESIYMDKRFVEDLGLIQCLPLDKQSECDEGLCIRVDKFEPYVLKAKSPLFLVGESKMLDSGEVDIESTESA